MKRFVTLMTIATLTLSSAVSVFAANSPASSTLGTPREEVTAEEKTNEKVEEATTTTVAADKLEYTEKEYFSEKGNLLGTYPVVKGMDELNQKIYDTIWKNHQKHLDNKGIDYEYETSKISYTVEENGQYSKITLNISYTKKTTSAGPTTDSFNFYVDKTTNKEVTEAVYTAAKTETAEEAKEEVKEETTNTATEAAAEEVAMVQLRSTAEKLGFTVSWDAKTKSVVISKDDKEVSRFAVNVNKYTLDGKEIELDSAPVLEEGTMYVPVSFFTKVLGATATLEKDGTYKIEITVEATK